MKLPIGETLQLCGLHALLAAEGAVGWRQSKSWGIELHFQAILDRLFGPGEGIQVPPRGKTD